MKAKEYHARYKANPTEDELINIAADMITETKQLAEQRRIKEDRALVAIIREQEDKWKAFVRLNPGINPGFFKLALHRLIPTAKMLYP